MRCGAFLGFAVVVPCRAAPQRNATYRQSVVKEPQASRTLIQDIKFLGKDTDQHERAAIAQVALNGHLSLLDESRVPTSPQPQPG